MPKSDMVSKKTYVCGGIKKEVFYEMGEQNMSMEPRDLFDTETGKRLDQETTPPDLFDSETGKPLGQMVESPDLFDPETGKPIKKPKKGMLWKKPGKPHIIGAAAAGICAVTAIATIVGGGLFENENDIVTDAIIEIIKTADDGFLEDTFGVNELSKLVTGGAVHVGGSLELDELPELETFGSGSGLLEFSRDVSNQAVLFSGTAEIFDMELGSAAVYMDDKKLMAWVPDSLDQVFTLNYADNLDEQIDGSFLAEQIGMKGEDAEFASNLMTDINQVMVGKKKRFDIAEIYNRCKETTKAADNLKNALEIEKIDAKTFKVNGKEQKCKGYDVVVPKKAIAEFVKAVSEFIVSDDQIKENELAYITDSLTVGRMLSGIDYDDARDWAEDQTDELIDGLKAGGDEIEDFVKDYMDDIELVLYVDKKGHAVYLAAQTSIDEYQVYDVEAEFTFAGGAVPTANMEGSIDVVSRGDSFRLDVEKIEKTTKEKWESEIEIKSTTAYDSLKLTLNTDYNRKNGDFEVEAGASTGEYRISAGLEGSVSHFQKGKSLTVEINSLDLRDPFMSWNGLEGSFFIEPLTGGVKAPEGEVFDVLAADRNDWKEVGEKILEQIPN